MTVAQVVAQFLVKKSLDDVGELQPEAARMGEATPSWRRPVISPDFDDCAVSGTNLLTLGGA